MNKPLYTRSILIGGVIAGALSGLPVIQAANCCCCCLWVILGGVIAAYVFVYNAQTFPRDGDGALVGLGAGAIAGIIASAMNAVTGYFSAPSYKSLEPLLTEVPPQFQEVVRQGLEQSVSLASTVFSMFMTIIVFSAVSALGGLIGIRIFRPLRMKQPTPPAWADYYWAGWQAPPPGWRGYYGPPPTAGPPWPGQGPADPGESSSGQNDDDRNDKPGPEGGGPASGSGPPAWGGQ